MYVFLVLAATVVTFFIVIFAGGALVGLVSLFALALGLRREVRVKVIAPKPVAPKAPLPEVVKADTSPAGAESAYAYA